MKYHYAYRDRNNERHDDVIVAASTEDAFRKLRAQGLRPFFVELAPGVWNRVQSFGKRGLALVLLGIVLAASALVIVAQKHEMTEAALSAVAPMARHQIYGDPVLMEDLERTDFSDIFTSLGERILARYAQPGHATFRALRPERSDAESLRPCLDSSIKISESDSREVQELKRIVLGMKGELRTYLADGVGTPETYLRRLVERLREEIAIRSRVETELQYESDPDAINKANAQLRALGLRPIPKHRDSDEHEDL